MDTVRDLEEFQWHYSRNEGLASAWHSMEGWYSGRRDLVGSIDYGGVVVVRAIGTLQKSLE